MEDALFLKYLAEHGGPIGLLSAAILGAAIYFHKTRMGELRTQADEHKADKADYKQVISGNTEAITKMAGALQENTGTIRDLRSYMEQHKP